MDLSATRTAHLPGLSGTPSFPGWDTTGLTRFDKTVAKSLSPKNINNTSREKGKNNGGTNKLHMCFHQHQTGFHCNSSLLMSFSWKVAPKVETSSSFQYEKYFILCRHQHE